MKLTKRYAIFDLDGTLLDTLDDLTDSMNYLLGKHNFPLRTRDEVRNFVGNGVRKLYEVFWGEDKGCYRRKAKYQA